MTVSPEQLDQQHPERRRALSTLQGRSLAWREAGDAEDSALVLLHGIGSGALAFAEQLKTFSNGFRVLAWDAPGYGNSSRLPQDEPLARDYATTLAEWLRAEGVRRCTVLGHSLGALIAAAFASDAAAPAQIQVRQVILASPALGYGGQAMSVRTAKRRERTDLIGKLGPAGMAAERAERLCTPDASANAIERVRWSMARCTVAGYEQAAHLLAEDSLRPYAARVQCPIHVLCGERDTVTPAAASADFARSIGAAFTMLPGAAHACYVEHADVFNAALRNALSVTANKAEATA